MARDHGGVREFGRSPRRRKIFGAWISEIRDIGGGVPVPRLEHPRAPMPTRWKRGFFRENMTFIEWWHDNEHLSYYS